MVPFEFFGILHTQQVRLHGKLGKISKQSFGFCGGNAKRQLPWKPNLPNWRTSRDELCRVSKVPLVDKDLRKLAIMPLFLVA